MRKSTCLSDLSRKTAKPFVAVFVLATAATMKPLHAAVPTDKFTNGSNNLLWADNGNWDYTANSGASTYPNDTTNDGQILAADIPSSNNVTISLNAAISIADLEYGYDVNAGTPYSSSLKNLTIAGSGTLTFYNELGATPLLYTGRFTTGATLYALTLSVSIAGTQGLSINQQSSPYTSGGLILSGDNTISGTITGYRLLTLTNTNAVKNATLDVLNTLNLQSNTSAEFVTGTNATAGLTMNSASASLYVDPTSTGAASGQTIKVAGNFVIASGSGIKTLSVNSSNTYNLELENSFSNTTTGASAAAFAIKADTANVRMATALGATVAIGTSGFEVGGALASGTNEIVGSISGSGRLAKTGASTWKLTNTSNTYTGGTIISGGVLEITSDGSLGGAYTGMVGAAVLIAGGSGYTTVPTVTISGTPGSGATATATRTSGNVVNGILITNGGSGFIANPTVTFNSASGTGATASAFVNGLLTFDGGILRTDAAITSVGRVINITANGGTIDTNSYDSSFSGAVNGSGSLNKVGAGTLTLSGNNIYTGTTAISGGTLVISGTTSGQGNYTVAADAALGGSGTIGLAANQSVTLAGTSSSHTANLSLGTSTMTINTSGAGATSFGDNSVLSLSISNDLTGKLAVQALDLSSSLDTINITATGTQTLSQYLIATYTGSLSGNVFNTVNISGLANASLDYSNSGQIYLDVPEPSTMTVGAAGLMFLLRRRRAVRRV